MILFFEQNIILVSKSENKELNTIVNKLKEYGC